LTTARRRGSNVELMPTTNPSIAQLQRAIVISGQIERLKRDLKSVLSGGQATDGVSTGNGEQASAEPATKKKRTMSASARKRIAAAQKARWAKSKGEKATVPVEAKAAPKAAKPGKKMRNMSPEARARIVAAQKARWAKFRTGKNSK
jgi:hypothetical protein